MSLIDYFNSYLNSHSGYGVGLGSVDMPTSSELSTVLDAAGKKGDLSEDALAFARHIQSIADRFNENSDDSLDAQELSQAFIAVTRALGQRNGVALTATISTDSSDVTTA